MPCLASLALKNDFRIELSIFLCRRKSTDLEQLNDLLGEPNRNCAFIRSSS
jgi:hypothetical protein